MSCDRRVLVHLLVVGLFPLMLMPSASAQTREHVLLARQVGLSPSQALSVLIANELAHVTQQPTCRQAGRLIVFDTTDAENPIALGDPVLFGLGAGESLAITNIQGLRLNAPGIDSGLSQSILEIQLVSDRPAAAGCGRLSVTVYGWDIVSKHTMFEVSIDPFSPPVFRHSPAALQRIPLGFLGLGSGQTGRVLLVTPAWTNFNDSDPGIARRAQCDFSGEVIVEDIPVVAFPDHSHPKPSTRQAYPIKWVGPSLKSGMTKAALTDVILKPSPGTRSELRVSLELKSRVPAACIFQLNGSLQVVDSVTSETKTSQSLFGGKYRPQFYIRTTSESGR